MCCHGDTNTCSHVDPQWTTRPRYLKSTIECKTFIQKIVQPYSLSAIYPLMDQSFPSLMTKKITNICLLTASPSIHGRSFLFIYHALRQDAGMYTCIAENPAGIATASAPVLMKGEYFDLRTSQTNGN
jgi:hypothetical protein